MASPVRSAFKNLTPTAVALGLISSPEEAEAAYIPLSAFKKGTDAAKKLYDEVGELIKKGVDDKPNGELYQRTGAYRSEDGDYKVDVAELRARDIEMASAVGEFAKDAQFFINNPKRTRAEIRTPINKYLPKNSPVFEYFPELADAKVVLRRGTAKEKGTYGYYSPNNKEIHVLLSPKDIPGGGNIKNPVKAFNTLIHEFQHHIQDVKNAKNTGFNTKRTGAMQSKVRQEINRLEKVVAENPQDELAQAQLKQYTDLRDGGPREDLDYRIYVRELGEAEARSSGRKAFLTADDPARQEVGVFYPATSFDPGTLEAVKIGSEVELPKEQILVRTYPGEGYYKERELEFVDPQTKMKAGLGSVAGLASLPSEAFAESLGLSTERTAMTDDLPIEDQDSAMAYLETRTAANPTTVGSAPSDIVTDVPIIGEGLMAADILQMVGESQKMEEGEEQPEPVDEFSNINRDLNTTGTSDEDDYNTINMRQGGGIATPAGEDMEDNNPNPPIPQSADLNKDGEIDQMEKMKYQAAKSVEPAEMNCGGMMGDPFAPMNVIVGMDGVSGNEIPAGSMAHEVRDDVPAMLSEGEYVVPADVVRWHGLKTFESLRGEAKMAMGLMAEHGRLSFVDGEEEYEEEEYEDDDDGIENENVEIEEAEVKVVHAAEGTSVEPISPQTFYRYVTRLNPTTGRYEFVAVDPTSGQQVSPDQFDPARATRYTPETVLGQQVYDRGPECPDGYTFDEKAGACVPVAPVAPPVSVATPTVSGGDGEGPPDVATPQYSERLGTRIAERLGPLSAEDLAGFEGATLAERAYGRMTDARPISLLQAGLAVAGGPFGVIGLGARSLYDEVGASRAALTRANEISGLAAGLDATALPRTYNFTFDPNTNSFKATSSTKITELQSKEGGGSWVTDYTHTDTKGNEIDPFASDADFQKALDAIEAEFDALPTQAGGGKPSVPVTDLSRPVDDGGNGGGATTGGGFTEGAYGTGAGSDWGGDDDNDNDNNTDSDSSNDDGNTGYGGAGDFGMAKGGYVARKNTPKIALLKR